MLIFKIVFILVFLIFFSYLSISRYYNVFYDLKSLFLLFRQKKFIIISFNFSTNLVNILYIRKIDKVLFFGEYKMLVTNMKLII